MSIPSNQQLNQKLMRLRKITITLWAHFSLGIAKFDTLSNLILTLDIKDYIKDFMNTLIINQCIILHIYYRSKMICYIRLAQPKAWSLVMSCFTTHTYIQEVAIL